MPHYTQDEWMRWVGENMPDATARGLEGYRNDNNVFVDGLQPPQYTGPLSTGGYAGTPPQTQGPSTVDPEDETTDQGALPAAFSSVPEWSKAMSGLTQEETAYGQKYVADRKAQYEAAQKALAERRFGPSEAEQLFTLAAAIGTPMIRPSFGGVMHNVGTSMAGIEKANREAQQQRADALLALNQSYANDMAAAQMAQFKERRAALQAQGPVLARMARPSGNSVWSESLSRFVPRDQVVPIKSGGIVSGPYKGGTAIQYSDGTHEVRTADGRTLRFGPDGQPVA